MYYYDEHERKACELVDCWLWACKWAAYGVIAYLAAKGLLS